MGWDVYGLWGRHFSDPRSSLRLASNPFLLPMLFSGWVSEGLLPKNRGDLFSRFIDRLLYREGLLMEDSWERTKEGDRLLKGLSELAWTMQRTRVRPLH